MKKSKGLVQIYTGDGKGKTTASLGLAMRAVGRGFKVIMIQFLKGEESGELLFVSRYHPFEIVQLNDNNCFQQSEEELRVVVERTWTYAEENVLSEKYDLVILDEVFVAVSKGLLAAEDILSLMQRKPEQVELVLTGRNAPSEVVKEADLVTEMLMIKHPYTEGIGQREGIEL